MGKNVPLSDSPYSLPHLIGWLLLGELLQYYYIIMGFHVVCRLLVVLSDAQHNAFSVLRSVLGWAIMSLDIFDLIFVEFTDRFY